MKQKFSKRGLIPSMVIKEFKVIEIKDHESLNYRSCQFDDSLALMKKEWDKLKLSDFHRLWHVNSSCISWIWCQWLMGNWSLKTVDKLRGFINRGIEANNLFKTSEYRELHNVLLLAVASFTGDHKLINSIFEVIDANENKLVSVRNNGERSAAAMASFAKGFWYNNKAVMKMSIEVFKSAYKPLDVRYCSLTVLRALLEMDGKKLNREQIKTYQALWSSGKKAGIIRPQKDEALTVSMCRMNELQFWCWAQNMLSMLAFLKQFQVTTDPWLFPEYAIKGRVD